MLPPLVEQRHRTKIRGELTAGSLGLLLQACHLLSIESIFKIKVLGCAVLNLQGMSLGFFMFTRCYSNLCGLFLYSVLPEHVTLYSGVNCTFGKMQFGLLYDA